MLQRIAREKFSPGRRECSFRFDQDEIQASAVSLLFARHSTTTTFWLLSRPDFCLFYSSPIQGRASGASIRERGPRGADPREIRGDPSQRAHAAYCPQGAPVSDNRRGNPVLWSRRFFHELMTLDGDIGARHLIARHSEAVAEVPVEGFGAFLDIDTPQALEAAQRG